MRAPEEIEEERPAVQPTVEPAAEPIAEEHTTRVEAAEEAGTSEPRSPNRYTKSGRRKGQYRFAAPLGLLVIVLSIVGAVSLVALGVRLIRDARDTSGMKDDLYYALYPLMQYAPTAFDSADGSEQDALIQAAIYKVTDADWIKQKQDSEYTSPYVFDDSDRLIIPIADINAAYAALFGTEVKPRYRTFGEDAGDYFTYLYDSENACYHVPYGTDSLMYEPVIDTIKRAGDTYKVRVGYVHIQDIKVDDRGNNVVTPAQAKYFQVYTVRDEGEGHFIILSVADDKTE